MPKVLTVINPTLARTSSSQQQCTKTESGIPHHPFVFPLSIDHLLTLVHFNAFRGFVTNMHILCIPYMFSCDEPPSMRVNPLPLPKAMPLALMPTSMQRTVPHYAWIDVFPLPVLRDNLIQLQESIDTCDLCDDVLGAMWDDQVEPHDDRNGVVVWGEPWDVNSWELMEGFVQKWGWMLTGCSELIEATNKWRVLRGERPFLYDDVVRNRHVEVVS